MTCCPHDVSFMNIIIEAGDVNSIIGRTRFCTQFLFSKVEKIPWQYGSWAQYGIRQYNAIQRDGKYVNDLSRIYAIMQ